MIVPYCYSLCFRCIKNTNRDVYRYCAYGTVIPNLFQNYYCGVSFTTAPIWRISLLDRYFPIRSDLMIGDKKFASAPSFPFPPEFRNYFTP